MAPFASISSLALMVLPRPYLIPASQTAEGRKRLREYYEALGRFVDMFARAETAVALTLWHYAKTSPPIAKIVFSGTRADMSSTYIRQIAQVTGVSKELCDDLDEVLQRLTDINKVRNHVLHYGADPESVAQGRAIVSNALRAREEPITFPISPTVLGEMTSDLHKIIAHLDQSHLGRTKGYTILGDPRHDAWKYKHPVPPNKRSKKGKDRR